MRSPPKYRRRAPGTLVVPCTEALGLRASPIDRAPTKGAPPLLDRSSTPPSSCSESRSSGLTSSGCSGNVAEGDLHCCLEEILALASVDGVPAHAAARLPELVADLRRDACELREQRVAAEWLLEAGGDGLAREETERADPFAHPADMARSSSPATAQKSALLLCAGLAAVALASGASATRSAREASSLARQLHESRVECQSLRSRLAHAHTTSAADGSATPTASASGDASRARPHRPLAAARPHGGVAAAAAGAVDQGPLERGPDDRGAADPPSSAGAPLWPAVTPRSRPDGAAAAAPAHETAAVVHPASGPQRSAWVRGLGGAAGGGTKTHRHAARSARAPAARARCGSRASSHARGCRRHARATGGASGARGASRPKVRGTSSWLALLQRAPHPGAVAYAP